ncbi:MAG: hypothetical protein UU56_C0002G0083 [Candidatus Curtissbacteria bacterium GW2011_GWA2_41_24]|nr:MAG: hypothetical protein UU56_C0002G0083 [Candidatus Curtissbacteria bacterium GW2011_GWA2_41_24]
MTIEPYVAAGGQLGEKIELDKSVAQGFVKAADLRRDVMIDRGQGLPRSQVVVMDDELALKGTLDSREHLSAKISHKSHYEVTKQPDRFIISVHDRLIDDSIRNSPEGSTDTYGYYEDEFIRRLNKALKGGLHDSFWQEKKELAREALRIHFLNLLSVGTFGTLAYGSYRFGMDFLPWFMRTLDPDHKWTINDYAFLTVVRVMWFTASGLDLLFLAKGYLESKNDKLKELNLSTSALAPRNLREVIFPSLPIASTVFGNLYLVRHGGKLIKKR